MKNDCEILCLFSVSQSSLRVPVGKCLPNKPRTAINTKQDRTKADHATETQAFYALVAARADLFEWTSGCKINSTSLFNHTNHVYRVSGSCWLDPGGRVSIYVQVIIGSTGIRHKFFKPWSSSCQLHWSPSLPLGSWLAWFEVHYIGSFIWRCLVVTFFEDWGLGGNNVGPDWSAGGLSLSTSRNSGKCGQNLKGSKIRLWLRRCKFWFALILQFFSLLSNFLIWQNLLSNALLLCFLCACFWHIAGCFKVPSTAGLQPIYCTWTYAPFSI